MTAADRLAKLREANERTAAAQRAYETSTMDLKVYVGLFLDGRATRETLADAYGRAERAFEAWSAAAEEAVRIRDEAGQ